MKKKYIIIGSVVCSYFVTIFTFSTPTSMAKRNFLYCVSNCLWNTKVAGSIKPIDNLVDCASLDTFPIVELSENNSYCNVIYNPNGSVDNNWIVLMKDDSFFQDGYLVLRFDKTISNENKLNLTENEYKSCKFYHFVKRGW